MLTVQIASRFTATLFDIAFAVLIILTIIRGYQRGFIRQITALIGLYIGILAGITLVPLLLVTTSDRVARTVITLIAVVGSGWIMSRAGLQIGEVLHKRVKLKGLHQLGSGAGSVLAGVSTLLAAWLVGAIFLMTPYAYLGATLQRSLILRAVSAILPPAPTSVSRLTAFLDPSGMPQVFAEFEPAQTSRYSLADQATIDAAVTLSGNATVRVSALSCSTLASGSGFVVAPDTVATNAHVVAGAHAPLVVDTQGPHLASIVYFDPNYDVALLHVSGLKITPLNLHASALSAGTASVVLGYPDGGPFSGIPSVVINQADITGRDIYGEATVTRPAYALEAAVRTGDSGGPVVLADGSVAGMVFGRSVIDTDVGYALPASVIAAAVAKTGSSTTPVSAKGCIGH